MKKDRSFYHHFFTISAAAATDSPVAGETVNLLLLLHVDKRDMDLDGDIPDVDVVGGGIAFTYLESSSDKT